METTRVTTNKVVRSPYFLPLVVGALWNIIFGSIGLFNLPLHIELFYHNVTPEAGYIANTGFWFAVFVAGIGYGVVGIVNHKFRFFVSLGAIGKIVFFMFVFYLWLGGVATNFAGLIALGDLLWGFYFSFFIYRTREYGYF